jgi:hypothetical protein
VRSVYAEIFGPLHPMSPFQKRTFDENQFMDVAIAMTITHPCHP